MTDNKLVADIAFVFKVGERERTLRYRSLPLSAWEELYHALGLEPASIIERIEGGSPVIIAALIWLERKQRERRLTWAQAKKDIEDQDVEFELVDLLIEGESQLREGDEEEPDDPPTPEA